MQAGRAGGGWWGLVRIGYPHRHAEHFEFIYRAFKRMNINLDEAPKNVCSLRGYSWDHNAYFNHKAVTLYHYIAPSSIQHREHGNYQETTNKFLRAMKQITEKKIDITRNYKDWFAIGVALAATYGEEGRDHYHNLSLYYKGYNFKDCDKQYTDCIAFAKEKKVNKGLNVFFAKCKECGV